VGLLPLTGLAVFLLFWGRDNSIGAKSVTEP
jgi:hypothetical protein